MAKKVALSKFERASYHEAGHAVMSYIVHRRLSCVSIVPDPNDNTLGRCEYRNLATFKPDAPLTGRLRNQVEKLITVLLSGAMSERLKVGHIYWKGSEDDMKQAHDLATSLCGNKREAKAYINWLWEHTRNILEYEACLNAVEALSEELRKREFVGERLAHKIIRESLNGRGG